CSRARHSSSSDGRYAARSPWVIGALGVTASSDLGCSTSVLIPKQYIFIGPKSRHFFRVPCLKCGFTAARVAKETPSDISLLLRLGNCGKRGALCKRALKETAMGENCKTVLKRIGELGCVLVVRCETEEEAVNGIRAVVEGGIRAVEVTFTVP